MDRVDGVDEPIDDDALSGAAQVRIEPSHSTDRREDRGILSKRENWHTAIRADATGGRVQILALHQHCYHRCLHVSEGSETCDLINLKPNLENFEPRLTEWNKIVCLLCVFRLNELLLFRFMRLAAIRKFPSL